MELEIRSLACRRGGRAVFAGLDFRVGPGEAALVRGPNGSGKSSLLRVLAGLTPPAAGDARLDGLSLAAAPEAWRERVALAGHLDAVKPALTVRRNLEIWAELFGGAAPVGAALERLGLAHVADDPAQVCSAGQRRRLGLARLLVVRRPLWLLDEPTVSLDAAAVEAVAAIVREHCAAGGIALAATHVEIGLPPGPEVRLGAERGGGDPFLSGDWAAA